MNGIVRIFAAILAALIAGCGQPVPADRHDYVGRWQAANMQLVIAADGSVDYQRVDGQRTTTIRAPIKSFDGANFTVGMGPLATTFVVTAIPHPEQGVWKMTVDGVELTRRADATPDPWGNGQAVRF